MRAELERRRHPFRSLYPSTGKYSRAAYSKHIEFFSASKDHTEISLLGGNRTGKSHAGSYAMVCHLTGLYPDWWTGKRFTTPISAWAAGDTSKTVRDIMQAKLIGADNSPASGMIPPDLIINKTPKAGVPGAIETVRIKHVSGGTSILGFKSYDQKRQSFQGTSQHVIWLDEEANLEIFSECVMRTMKTTDFDGGIVYLTFTPLMGLSQVVQLFLPDGSTPSPDRYTVFVGWDDIPHLDEADKAERIKKIPAFQRDARTKGIPSLGSGSIYPMSEDDILCEPFIIPKHYRKVYALDVGGGFAESSTGGTAALWGAINPENGTCFIYDEYFRSGAEPSVHAAAIKARGSWMKGVVDPAARGRSQIDGRQLLQMYKDLGLDLLPADNSVEAGLWMVWDAFSTGMLKVFNTLPRFRKERNLYRRDEKGRVVKENDHLCDCLRYLYVTGRDRATIMPSAVPLRTPYASVGGGGSMGWVK